MTRGDKPLPTEHTRELYTPLYATRGKPQTPPTVPAFAAPLQGCCINVEWMSHILGTMASLEWSDAWEGTPEEKQFALDQIIRIQDAMACPCGAGDRVTQITVTENYRLQLALEFNLNGLDGVAPDRPDTFFDEDTSDVGDDIIKRENALCMACIDYVHTLLDEGVSTAQNAGIGIGLEGIPIAFALGPIAGLAWVSGVIAITGTIVTVFQDPQTRLDIACCMLDGLKEKAITEVNFEASLSDCGFTVPSVKDTVREFIEESLNDQGNFISFVRILGAYFSAADLVPLSCPCIEQGLVCDFRIDECDFEVVLGPNGPEAFYDGPLGWLHGPSGVINHLINIKSEFTQDHSFDAVRIFIKHTNTDDIKWTMRLFDDMDVLLLQQQITLPPVHTNHKFEFAQVTGVRRLEIQVFKTGLATGFLGHITLCQVEADPPPFPTQVP